MIPPHYRARSLPAFSRRRRDAKCLCTRMAIHRPRDDHPTSRRCRTSGVDDAVARGAAASCAGNEEERSVNAQRQEAARNEQRRPCARLRTMRDASADACLRQSGTRGPQFRAPIRAWNCHRGTARFRLRAARALARADRVAFREKDGRRPHRCLQYEYPGDREIWRGLDQAASARSTLCSGAGTSWE